MKAIHSLIKYSLHDLYGRICINSLESLIKLSPVCMHVLISRCMVKLSYNYSKGISDKEQKHVVLGYSITDRGAL